MSKVKFYLKNPDTKTESLIFLVYRHQKLYFKYYTGEYVIPESWDFKKQRPTISKNYPLNSDVEKQLSKYDFFLTDLINELKRKKSEISCDLLKANLDIEFRGIKNESEANGKKIELIGYIERYIQDCKDGKRITNKGNKYQTSTINSYKNTQKHLNDYLANRHICIDFNDITIEFYDDLLYYFQKIDISTNTIGKQIKNIKAIMNASFEDGLHSNLEFQRKRFKKINEESDTIYLTEEEINRIYKLDLSKNNKLEKVRDLFIVAVRTALRFSDLVNLCEKNFFQKNNMYYLRIHTQKTIEEVIVPMKLEVIEILNKYDNKLPREISNQKMNEYLKDIGKLAELNSIVTKVSTKGGIRIDKTFEKWELLSTHTARRSAATNLFLAEIPSLSIMKLTGHKTDKSFMKYIRMSKEENAYKMAENEYFKNDYGSDIKLKIV